MFDETSLGNCKNHGTKRGGMNENKVFTREYPGRRFDRNKIPVDKIIAVNKVLVQLFPSSRCSLCKSLQVYKEISVSGDLLEGLIEQQAR